jgi:predicted RND superfamily exporter protein
MIKYNWIIVMLIAFLTLFGLVQTMRLNEKKETIIMYPVETNMCSPDERFAFPH